MQTSCLRINSYQKSNEIDLLQANQHVFTNKKCQKLQNKELNRACCCRSLFAAFIAQDNENGSTELDVCDTRQVCP